MTETRPPAAVVNELGPCIKALCDPYCAYPNCDCNEDFTARHVRNALACVRALPLLRDAFNLLSDCRNRTCLDKQTVDALLARYAALTKGTDR